jgi:D-amino-acid oxidase
MADSFLDRRSILRLGLLALAGTVVPVRRSSSAGLPSIAGDDPGNPVGYVAVQQDAISLPKVQVFRGRIIRTVAGLRPYRPSGFLVRADRVGAKVIIHNYGHGGCGVTLSWGTGQLAVDLALKTHFRMAAVLGCGAVGLATARLLQDHGFQVTIYAKDLPPNTTSNIAGASWGPVTLADHDRRTPEFTSQFEQASRVANRYFQTLVGDRYGIKWAPMFYAGDSQMGPSWPSTVTPELYPTTELAKGTHPFPSAFVSRRYTMLIEPNTYLPALISDFYLRGGRIVVKDFASLASIMRLREGLIVNCTGLGAKALFHDEEMDPIKGQLTVLVPQPEIDYGVVSTSSDLYMFPRRDGIVLGGTHERGVWSLKPNEAEADRIFRGHQQFFAAMQ